MIINYNYSYIFLPRCLQLSAISQDNSLKNGSENTGRTIVEFKKKILMLPPAPTQLYLVSIKFYVEVLFKQGYVGLGGNISLF